jgi:hypothetical protein
VTLFGEDGGQRLCAAATDLLEETAAATAREGAR